MRPLPKTQHLFLFLYPILVWSSEEYGLPSWFKWCLCGVGFLLLVFRARLSKAMTAAMITAALLFYFFRNSFFPERLYPFALSLSYFVTILSASRTSSSWLVAASERFRKIGDEKRQRLRRATPIWTVGLAVNTGILFLFLFKYSTAAWLLYSNALSYGLLLALFVATVAVVDGSAWLVSAVYIANHCYNFAVFGVMCLVGIPFVYVLVPFSHLDPARYTRFVQWVCYHSFRFVRFHCRFFHFIDMRFVYHPGSKPGKLLVCNHLSMFDIVAILAEFPHCYTFVNTKFLANPLLRPIVKACGYIPVDVGDVNQGAGAFEQARKLLQRGATLVVFPEGSRSRDGRLGPLHKGVFRLACITKIPITPIFITTDRPFLNNAKLFRPSLRPLVFRAHVMAPLPFHGLLNQRAGAEKLREEFARRYHEFAASEDALAWNRKPSIVFNKMFLG